MSHQAKRGRHNNAPSSAICHDYNSSFGCTRNHYCNYRHEYVGNVVATCHKPTTNPADTALVQRFSVQRIGTYTLYHTVQRAQQNTIEYYDKHISFDATATPLHVPQLGTVIQECDKHVTETVPSLLPIIMTLKYHNASLSQYNFVTYRNSLNYIVCDDEPYRIHIQRVGNTVFLKPCSSIGARVYSRHNRGVAGYLFESVCAGDDLHGSDYKEYVYVARLQIGEFVCAVAAEVDGMMSQPLHNQPHITQLTHRANAEPPQQPVSVPYYVELKTNAGGDIRDKRFAKMLTQSYLVNIPYILLAKLTRTGADTQSAVNKQPLRTLAVESLQYIDVQHEMTDAEQAARLQQAHHILQFITQNTQPNRTYRLHRCVNSGSVTYELAELDGQRYSFVQQHELVEVQRWRDKRHASKSAASSSAH